MKTRLQGLTKNLKGLSLSLSLSLGVDVKKRLRPIYPLNLSVSVCMCVCLSVYLSVSLSLSLSLGRAAVKRERERERDVKHYYLTSCLACTTSEPNSLAAYSAEFTLNAQKKQVSRATRATLHDETEHGPVAPNYGKKLAQRVFLSGASEKGTQTQQKKDSRQKCTLR